MRPERKWRLHLQLAGRLLLLAAALLHPASGDSPESPVLDEAAVMSRLRQFARDSGMVTAGMHWGGWDPGDRTHHCQWHHVKCNTNHRVESIEVTYDVNFLGGPEANRLGNITLQPLPRPVALPPELAQLQHLQALELVAYGHVEQLPAEWGQPGAFPSLLRLVVDVIGFTTPEPLPPVMAGALQSLESFDLHAQQQDPPLLLPPSWGQRGVLPALRTLTMEASVALPLPASWSQGFPGLVKLVITTPNPGQAAAANLSSAEAVQRSPAAAAAPGAAPPTDAAAKRLPDSWAAGFPSLQTLWLNGMGLSGSFPAAWEHPGSFPSLIDLSLRQNNLLGPLPARLPCNLPRLASLELADNQFTGTLPQEWGVCTNGLAGFYVGNNQLAGPAFPDAWVAPNTSLRLWHLSLPYNRGLTGTLPARLPWNDLTIMSLRNTSTSGTIPEQWCTAQFAAGLRQLDLIDTKIDLTLPPCAVRAMPKLVMSQATRPPAKEQDTRGQAASAAAAGASSATGTSKLLLLAVVAGVAAAALAVARWKQRGLKAPLLSLPSRLRRRGQRPAALSLDGDGIELLAVASDTQSDQLRQRQPHGLELAPGRARIKALVQRQMGGSALPSGKWERRLLSQGMLPQAVAHQLDSGRHAADAGKRASSGTDSGGSQGSGGSSGGVPIFTRQWGLETDSLRLCVSDLQFIAEPDGSLVQLGEGAHGVVYLAKLQDLYVACKVFELQPGMHSQAFWHEISLLARCQHPRIVPVYGVAIQGRLLMVAVQLMLGGSLRNALLDPERQQELRWEARGRQVALDVAEALVYLHEDARILHSDVKSANVLLSQGWRAALSDFGVAQVLAGSARTAAGGSSLYAAPEQLLGKRCTLAADIYSLGLLLVELLTRRPIIRRGDWEPPRPGVDCPQEVAELVEGCLSSEPLSRPPAAQVLRCLQDSGSGSGSSNELRRE